MNQFEEKLNDFLVEFIEKPEEKRVFISARNIPRQGKHPEPLTKDQEIAAVTLGKEWYEQHRGVMLLNFHKDPLAGGMRPQTPVKGQLWRSGFKRKPVFQATRSGELVPQGNVGELTQERVESNIQPGQAIMIATPMWTGEWL